MQNRYKHIFCNFDVFSIGATLKSLKEMYTSEKYLKIKHFSNRRATT